MNIILKNKTNNQQIMILYDKKWSGLKVWGWFLWIIFFFILGLLIALFINSSRKRNLDAFKVEYMNHFNNGFRIQEEIIKPGQPPVESDSISNYKNGMMITQKHGLPFK